MPVQKWEYKVVRIKEGQKYEVSSDIKGQESIVDLHHINELGEEGWELINVVKLEPVREASPEPRMESVNPYAYFKRPLQRQAKFVGAQAKRATLPRPTQRNTPQRSPGFKALAS